MMYRKWWLSLSSTHNRNENISQVWWRIILNVLIFLAKHLQLFLSKWLFLFPFPTPRSNVLLISDVHFQTLLDTLMDNTNKTKQKKKNNGQITVFLANSTKYIEISIDSNYQIFFIFWAHIPESSSSPATQELE